MLPYVIDESEKAIQNGDPFYNLYESSGVSTSLLLRSKILIGVITRADSTDVDFPSEESYFFISLSDGWAVGMLAVPYGGSQNILYTGQYSQGTKLWKWTAK